MARTGQCVNYAGCPLADRNESIVLQDDAPFICPECKQPLIACGSTDGRKPRAIPVLILGGITLLVVMGSGAVYFQVRHFREKQAAGQIGTSFEQAEVAAAHGEFMPSRHMAAIPDTAAPGASAAPSGVQVEVLSAGSTGNQQARADFLNWIAVTPTLSPADKEKLSSLAGHARLAGRILTVSFPSGHVAVSPVDADQLSAAVASAAFQPFIKDPACVFAVLGFADATGDETATLYLSAQRAQGVLNILRNRCGLPNVMYALGMNGHLLPGNEPNAERKGIAEVWALVP